MQLFSLTVLFKQRYNPSTSCPKTRFSAHPRHISLSIIRGYGFLFVWRISDTIVAVCHKMWNDIFYRQGVCLRWGVVRSSRVLWENKRGPALLLWMGWWRPSSPLQRLAHETGQHFLCFKHNFYCYLFLSVLYVAYCHGWAPSQRSSPPMTVRTVENYFYKLRVEIFFFR